MAKERRNSAAKFEFEGRRFKEETRRKWKNVQEFDGNKMGVGASFFSEINRRPMKQKIFSAEWRHNEQNPTYGEQSFIHTGQKNISGRCHKGQNTNSGEQSGHSKERTSMSSYTEQKTKTDEQWISCEEQKRKFDKHDYGQRDSKGKTQRLRDDRISSTKQNDISNGKLSDKHRNNLNDRHNGTGESRLATVGSLYEKLVTKTPIDDLRFLSLIRCLEKMKVE